jgi:hypothetical protein
LGDYQTFGKLTGNDYLTANADGSYGDKAQTPDRIKNNPLPRLDTLIFKEDRLIAGLHYSSPLGSLYSSFR